MASQLLTSHTLTMLSVAVARIKPSGWKLAQAYPLWEASIVERTTTIPRLRSRRVHVRSDEALTANSPVGCRVMPTQGSKLMSARSPWCRVRFAACLPLALPPCAAIVSTASPVSVLDARAVPSEWAETTRGRVGCKRTACTCFAPAALIVVFMAGAPP